MSSLLTGSELDTIAADIRKAADQCGARVLASTLSIDATDGPSADVAPGDFASLVAHVRPRLVYLVVDRFDAVKEVSSSLDLDEPTPFLDRGPGKKLIARWRPRDGETCRLMIGVMCDGVAHLAFEEVAWLADFEGEAEAAMSGVIEARDRKAEEERSRTLGPMVRQLMTDPRFVGPKVGVAKRRALAEHLFPGADSDTLGAIVVHAEREHWLATAGR